MLKYRQYFYALSLTLVIASIISIWQFGLNFGLDFTGGSLLEVEFGEKAPAHNVLREKMSAFNVGEIIVQSVGERGLMLRFAPIDEAKHQEILSAFKDFGEFSELRFESVGPVIGGETKRKSAWAIILVVGAILAYVAWAFRRISFPLSSWKYGLIAVIALFHDIIITVGVFSVLGRFLNVEVGVPFIAALLTIFGYSVNDTIVVFDRIRENVVKVPGIFDFGEIINKSVRETFIRSLNTSLTTLFALFAILFFGGETIHYFALALIIGITVGTYSSIFLASPLLFSWAMLKNRQRT